MKPTKTTWRLARKKFVFPQKGCRGKAGFPLLLIFYKGEVEMTHQSKLKRPIQRVIRFNQNENDYINKKIEDSPFKNFQNFARTLLIMGEVKVYDYSELKSLVSEVNKVGNNINQIVKLANQFDEVSAQDIQNLTATLTQLQQTVNHALQKEIAKERRQG